MNRYTENATSGSSEKPDRHEEPLTLEVARRMLPLVQRVVGDILRHNQQLATLLPEQERLDQQRRKLAWPDRLRRYNLREEIAQEEHNLLDARAELEVLGLEMLDARTGRLGFPTIVNDQAAFFSWLPGEEDITFWHFADETIRRRIPASWSKAAERVGNSR